MQHSIVLCSPIVTTSKYQSGISLRIKEIAIILKKFGHKVIIIDKIAKKIPEADFYYCLISTKTDSITASLIKNLSPNAKLIIDLYTPILLEKEAAGAYYGILGSIKKLGTKNIILKELKRGNYFIVANHRQKIYWINTAKNLGIRLKATNISVLPTGAPKGRKIAATNNIKSTILWFGGIYPWMNPLPLLLAFSNIAQRYPNWKLLVLGGYHPRTGYAKIYKEIKKNAKIIPKKQVVFIPWQKVNYLEDYLKDVAFAVHISKKTSEDFYAHRIRLLTLTTFSIPVLTSGKDLISNFIIKNEAGLKISESISNTAKTITNLIKFKKNLKKLSYNTNKIQRKYLKEEADYQNFKKFLSN